MACSRETPAPEETRSGRVRFVVDESLLGPAHRSRELGLFFRPPAGWEEISRELIDQALDAVPEQPAPGTFTVRPRAAFLSPANGSFCLLSRLETDPPPAGAAELNREVGNYVLELKETFREARVDEGQFTVDSYRAIQLRIITAEQVLFKLILTSPGLQAFQVDYRIPRPVFEEEVIKLESSIGSLQRLQE